MLQGFVKQGLQWAVGPGLRNYLPSHILNNFGAFLSGVTAAYCQLLFLFGPHSFFGNGIDILIANVLALALYYAIDRLSLLVLGVMKIPCAELEQQHSMSEEGATKNPGGGPASGSSGGGGMAAMMKQAEAMLAQQQGRRV